MIASVFLVISVAIATIYAFERILVYRKQVKYIRLTETIISMIGDEFEKDRIKLILLSHDETISDLISAKKQADKILLIYIDTKMKEIVESKNKICKLVIEGRFEEIDMFTYEIEAFEEIQKLLK